MKFVHIADFHFDTPFKTLGNLGNVRRIEQREIFRKMINYIKENKVDYLFIAGDLFEQSTIRESTIEYMNRLFGSLTNTKIFISPGNHDPRIKNSYYNTYTWADNVHIFGGEFEKIEEPEFNLYGYGFEDFTVLNSGLKSVRVDKFNGKPNILLCHASLDGGEDEKGVYNSITTTDLKDLSFDYCALGHIHKQKLNENIIYPGSTCSLGFDEPGQHGMVVGTIDNGRRGSDSIPIKIEFIPLDSMEFTILELDLTRIKTLEELIENINLIKFDDNKYYELVFTGRRNFEIDTRKIKELLSNQNILKLKDTTKQSIDFEKLSKEKSLKGIFVRNMMDEMANANEDERDLIESALEYGLGALK